jgi:hypothetical protein
LLLAVPALTDGAPKPLVHQGTLYGFAAGNLGVPILSRGQTGGFTVGAGCSLQLSERDAGWYFEAFGELAPAWWVVAVTGAGVQNPPATRWVCASEALRRNVRREPS